MQLPRPSPGRRTSCIGFSLIELMIAVAVIALLASLAYPAFTDAIRKGRRADAIAALGQIQQAQERWRSTRAAYTTALTTVAPNGLGLPSLSSKEYYDLSITAADGVGYTVVATGRSGTTQAADSCRRLAVQMAGGNVLYSGCGPAADCALPAFAAAHTCWAR